MNRERAGNSGKYLDELYAHWGEIRKETIEQLGAREALKIVDFHGNNWIDVVRWVSSTYERQDQMNIVSFQLSRLFKEIYWLQFLFLAGNYSTAYRNLRWILELISQAYYVDAKYPTLSLDEQIEKTMEIEENVFGWNIVSSTLVKVLNRRGQQIQAFFGPLWRELNRHAHPSAKQMDLIAMEDFSALVTDSFNENLAKELLVATDRVFDIVYAVVLKRFPKAKSLVREYEFLDEWERCLPITMSIIRQ